MPFGIDDILMAVAPTLVGGFMGSDSAGDAASTQASATREATAATAAAQDRATREIGRQYDLTRSDLTPFRTAGVSALDALRSMMGLPADASSAPASRNYAGSLVDTSGAVPRPLQQLYATDEGYRKAWDDFSAAHQQWAGSGFSADSDVATIEREVRARLPEITGGPVPKADATSVSASPLNRQFSIDDFWKDPVVQASYQSGLELGQKALKNAAPLTTGIDSGAALKELTKFGTDYTGNMAAGSQSRFEGNKTNVYNRLMGLVTGGQTANSVDANAGNAAASGIAGTVMNAGNNTANLISAGGNANAAAKIAGGNAWSGALGNLSNWWSQKNLLDRAFPQNGFRTPGTFGVSPILNSNYGSFDGG